jgi:hypothetical protein
LVQTGPDEFREIFRTYFDRTGSYGLDPTKIVRADGDELLQFVVHSGALGYKSEHYFFFSENGPVHLDLSPLYRSASKADGDWDLASGFDFSDMTWSIGINPEQAKVTCCTGFVVVTFRIERDGRVVPTATKTEPWPDR